MKSFEQFIVERSFGKKDIPKAFRVVFDIKKDGAVESLNKMVISGIKGISDSGEIIYEFLGVGLDAMLVMNGQKLVDTNKLSRVMYNNPHYMLSKNLEASKRLFNRNDDKSNAATWHRLFEYIFKRFLKDDLVSSYDLQASTIVQSLSWTDAASNTKINTVKDAARMMKVATKQLIKKKTTWKNYDWLSFIIDLPDSKLQKYIYDGLLDMGKVYKVEGEWLIKNKKLVIPKGSILYILTTFNNDMIKRYEKGELDGNEMLTQERYIKREIEFRDKIKKAGLAKKYLLKWLDWKAFEASRKKMFAKKYSN
ncbi:MAG: hypothetical protein DRR06_19870 [Gammaproteobacteria bacterium]|nr:MAG: hypothetical protein DRR06_19870 [Gammaproteobacteria bacterium]